ncbi:dethiobiotin synthase [Oleiagrimonas sp. C23AA]|uniref:dethiobiotin synthase n=1 Tax=Oleiagrimonas sp. C23AA TaxID=2719047 RepID=UPI0014243EDD|nr:dethiobiotin synthase [Oleiagrimonas sp. C23AA]NII11404.1 dethiobiotin synthase [Oleiagrimonas sp. C23AA]
MSAPCVFIAGTDTGIGKTHASVTLMYALREHGLRVAGMKPVASGCDETADGRRNADALALQAAGSPMPAYAKVNPVALRAPVSPHLAAEEEGVVIDLEALYAGYQELTSRYESVVVEGVGGWMVPLGDELMAGELARRFELPVILVVGLRLGCLNHALLSARAIQADGARLLGWVGNRIDPHMDMVDANVRTLQRMMPVPCLGELPHGESPLSAARHISAAAEAVIAAAKA